MIDISCKDLLTKYRSNHPEVFLGKCSENMQQIYRRTPMPVNLLHFAAFAKFSCENNYVTYYMLYEFT